MRGVRERYGNLELGRFIGELVRTLMSVLVDDVLSETRRAHRTRQGLSRPRTSGATTARLRHFPQVSADEVAALKRFLFAHMYRHPRVMAPMGRAQAVVTELFAAFSDDPKLLPADWAALCGAPGDATTGGVVRDYIAGMTDRFAMLEYGRVFHTEIAL